MINWGRRWERRRVEDVLKEVGCMNIEDILRDEDESQTREGNLEMELRCSGLVIVDKTSLLFMNGSSQDLSSLELRKC